MSSQYLVVASIFCSLIGFSDSMGQTSSVGECRNQAGTFAHTYAMHLKNNETQKMGEIVFAWEQECGLTEPVFRAKAIHLIMAGDFPGVLENFSLLNYAIAFSNRQEIIEINDSPARDEQYTRQADYYGFVPVSGDFDRQIQRKAMELLSSADSDELSFAILTLYSGNTDAFFSLLREGVYVNTDLGEEYGNLVEYWKKKPEFNFGLSSGIWFPTYDLKLIGPKPFLGVVAGLKIRNTTFNGVFDIRFGKTRQPFEMNIRDTLIQTRNHQGAYLGLEINQIIFKQQAWSVGLFVSGGNDFIDMVEDKQLPQRQTFGTWALQAGPFVSIVFSNRMHLGIKPGIVLLNHENTVGSSLKGNAYSLRFVLGISDNPEKTRNLETLGY